MSRLTNPTVFLMGCRTFEQVCCTLRGLLEPKRFCPFCTLELKRRKREVLAYTRAWKLLTNEFPHRDTETMLLIIPDRHISTPDELTDMDWVEIGQLFSIARHRHHIESGGIMLRFGDPHLHAGTIEHFHINVIRPMCGKEYRPPFAKSVSDHEYDYERLLGFREKLTERGGMEWLFSEKGIEETQPRIL